MTIETTINGGQWYAGKYMQGASASGEAYEWAGLAEDSFRAADAMIAHEKGEA